MQASELSHHMMLRGQLWKVTSRQLGSPGRTNASMWILSKVSCAFFLCCFTHVYCRK